MCEGAVAATRDEMSDVLFETTVFRHETEMLAQEPLCVCFQMCGPF